MYYVKVFELYQKRQVDSICLPQNPVNSATTGPQETFMWFLCDLEKDTSADSGQCQGTWPGERACPGFLSVLTSPCSVIYDALTLDSSEPSVESQTRDFQQALLWFPSLPAAEITESLPLLYADNYKCTLCSFWVRFHLKKGFLCLYFLNVWKSAVGSGKQSKTIK